jgi:hypothetical protein
MKKRNPHFVSNAVLPNSNFGTILAKSQPTTTGMWIKNLYDGNTDPLKGVQPRKFHIL